MNNDFDKAEPWEARTFQGHPTQTLQTTQAYLRLHSYVL